MEMTARYVLDEESDINIFEEVRIIPTVFVMAIDGIATRKWKIVCNVSPGLSPKQMLSLSLKHFPSPKFKYSSPFDIGKRLRLYKDAPNGDCGSTR